MQGHPPLFPVSLDYRRLGWGVNPAINLPSFPSGLFPTFLFEASEDCLEFDGIDDQFGALGAVARRFHHHSGFVVATTGEADGFVPESGFGDLFGEGHSSTPQ